MKEDTIINRYKGFKPLQRKQKLDSIKLSSISSSEFYEKYVRTRTPVVIDDILNEFKENGNYLFQQFQPENIVDFLKKDDNNSPVLQIEKKFQGGFGSGIAKTKMGFQDFIEALYVGNEDLYLTTQYYNEESHENNNIEESSDENEDENQGILDFNDFQSYEPNSSGNNVINDDDDDDDDDDDSLDDFDFDIENMHDDFDEMNNNLLISKEFEKDPLYLLEARTRLFQLFQTPLTYSLQHEISLPIRPSFLNLVSQQINLWVGSSSSGIKSFSLDKLDIKKDDLGFGKLLPTGGTSSGLHHDHADNLYIPITGTKRFTIFAPSEAENLYTVGDVDIIYESGVIDYKTNNNAPSWQKVRSDGAIIEINLSNCNENASKKLDPPSFSKIPPILLHLENISNHKNLVKAASTKYPRFFKAIPVEVTLKPGQMLFLPCGWFHEVSSSGEERKDGLSIYHPSNNIHVAINYWFFPPDSHSFNQPYNDKFWENDFKRTLMSYNEHLKKRFKI
ncbi:Clavaminate synthase-like protein [Ascoidea rubescens DSM 1968]|uniref:Clavaminate synthase-like protein n=1 Tax=Ascoidea rubescens DSM 1968 TaxID=1344418 RepID=A0A1D2V9S1_9ASCO|nr:Clavaminate synthase-like protein [Ascoidea rubescens DSM 1968]ODV58401.1 Clavaminate synthase-like protein [Ascoidea rubescens DSM 1968]